MAVIIKVFFEQASDRLSHKNHTDVGADTDNNIKIISKIP